MKQLLLFILMLIGISPLTMSAESPSDTLIVIYKEESVEHLPLYTVITLSNVIGDIDDEVSNNILDNYINRTLPSNDTLIIKTTVGVVHGRFNRYTKDGMQRIKFTAFKYVWNDGSILYVEDRKKF